MIQISEASLSKLIVHKVGNKVCGDELVLSNRVIADFNDSFKESVLMHYLFSPFKGNSFFNFTHSSDLRLNEVYAFCAAIFDGDADFGTTSKRVASHLYEVSDRPNIKSGELYVAFFKDVIVDAEVCDAVGIFKSESKETFLKVQQFDNGLDVGTESGVNINKLDKGCLIFNTERDFGFKVCAIDNTNHSEAVYWKESFLQVKPRDDSYYQTLNYMEACKGFVKNVFNADNNVASADQAEILNKTASFFKQNEVFKEEVFFAEVLVSPEVVELFNDYKETYQEQTKVALNGDFSIASEVAKKMQKHFKSVLKLDKNFHVYLHGDRSLVEKGFDQDKGMNFYKLYFNSENL